MITKLGRNDSNIVFSMKNLLFLVFSGKNGCSGFSREKTGIPGKRRNFCFISRKLSGTPYCAQIYLKSIKASLKKPLRWHEYTYI
jgi:hypothetical protein